MNKITFLALNLMHCCYISLCTAQIRNKKGRRSHSKLVSLLSKPEKQCVLFSNEHHVETFLPRLSEETTRQWHTR